jgi:hypothetical protein
MDTILINTQERIKAAVAAIKHVDENWGQLDLYGPQIPVKWPCALIDINQAQFSNIGKDIKAQPVNRQQGTVVLEITVADVKLTNSSGRAPQVQKQPAYRIWQIVNDIHKAVQGWKPDEMAGGLIRVGLSKIRRDDGVQEVRVLYSTGLNDC